MTDYTGNRRASWQFTSVDLDTLNDASVIANITGGRVSASASSDVKYDGSLDYDGTMPADSQIVRIAYTFTDDEGATATHEIATLLMECDEPRVREVYGESGGEYTRIGVEESGTALLFGLLKILADVRIGASLCVTAGTNSIDYAAEICRQYYLTTNEPSSVYVLQNDMVYDAGASLLEIANDLCAAAGYRGLSTDSHGRVLFVPSASNDGNGAADWTFRAGAGSVFEPTIAKRTNWHDVPNVLWLNYSDDEVEIFAQAVNNDPASGASIATRGREVTRVETVSELDGDTVDEKVTELMNRCAAMMVELSAGEEYRQIECAYVPVALFSTIALEYAYEQWRGEVDSMEIEMSADAHMSLSVRKTIPADFSITVNGGAR